MSQRKIFVAIDGSKQSDNAFNFYLEHINRPGDLAILIHSAEYHVDMGLLPSRSNVDAITKEMAAEDERIGNMVGNYMEILKKKSIIARTIVLKGHGMKSGEAIVNSANEESPAMIILGSRGLGKIRRTVLGSVSEYVLHHAPQNCAVTILRDA